MKMNLAALLAAGTLVWGSSVLADNDNTYKLTNDMSFISGDISSIKHIYYPGDTIDIRVNVGGNTQLLASQAVDIYLGIVTPNGVPVFQKVQDYQTLNSQRLFYMENITSSVVNPGTYNLAVIATKPGGNPANVEDWYNGFAGMLDSEAVLYSSASVAGDSDLDGNWDNDFDRDGYYGDDDGTYEDYYSNHGTLYKSSEYREWEDNDWSDDEDDDWDNEDHQLEWDD